MAITYWTQDVFSQGELSPLMYSRVTVTQYFNSMKTAKNVFTIPQGGATKRFGTKFLNQILGETDYKNTFFKSWQYLDECTYIVVALPGCFDYYLEGTLQERLPVVLEADEIRVFDYTVLDARFRVTTGLRKPFDMVRTNFDAKTVNGFTASTLTVTTSVLVVGRVAPIVFTGGVAPLSVPVIVLGTQYFSRVITTNSFAVYATAADANADVNRNAITNAGTTVTATFDYTGIILGFAPTTLTIDCEMLTVDDVSAVTFLTPVPTSSPQIRLLITYFSRAITSSSVAIYLTAEEAVADVNRYDISAIGAVGKIVFQNKFTLTDVVFRNVPVFDFGEVNYDGHSFKLSAATGTATLTSSVVAGFFDNSYIGGSYVGNGGVGRIISVGSATVLTLSVLTTFTDIAIQSGKNVVVTKPAWSDETAGVAGSAKGWPKKCSSYQSRAIFASTELLPNGVWLSVINNYADFNDLETDDDSAISWYPTSNNVNVIKFIVPYRSLTIHTNSGIYSTPLLQDSAITPKNFSLTLQDSTPATVVSPRAIDNQIIILSGNDAHTMTYDGMNNAYTSNLISVVNEQVIRDPIDESEFRDLSQAGSRYMFVVNKSGSLAIYQTIIEEKISGWTTSVLEQSYGTAKFRAVTSNFDGRLWFMNERELASASATIAITAFSGNEMTATASNFEVQTVTALKFTVVGAAFITTPQITTSVYYWTVGIDANTFIAYLTQADAIASTNPIAIEATATIGGTTVEPWPLVTRLEVEELASSGVVDGAGNYSGALTSTLTSAARFNAQEVKIQGKVTGLEDNGYGFEAIGFGDEIQVVAHGLPVDITQAEYGFPIETIIEPMPLSISMGKQIQSSNLAKPKHIKYASFMVNETIGGTVNNVPIAVNKFNQVGFGVPPTPMTGFFEFSVAKGWDDFNNPTFTIKHNEPFNFRLLGIFYTLEI